MVIASSRLRVIAGSLLFCCAGTAGAFDVPAPQAGAPAPYRAPAMQVDELGVTAAIAVPSPARTRAQSLGDASRIQIDRRTGRVLTVMPSTPLLAGKGVGNDLAGTTPTEPEALRRAAWTALRGWLATNRAALAIDLAELDETARVTIVGDDYLQVYSGRTINGIPVRGAELTATIKQGNLILFGLRQWGDVPASAIVRVPEAHALAAIERHVAPLTVGRPWKAAELMWQPVAAGDAADPRLEHRLAWVIRTQFGTTDGRFETVVDAENGEVLSIEDTTHYVATPRVGSGGVYPLSNDNVAPDGVEQLGWPMPYLNVTTPGGVRTTDGGGKLGVCVDGDISASLTGPYVRMNDSCGASSLTASGSLDFGGSGGIDCTTPGIGGTGNTHSSRTAFYELNKIIAMARSYQPNNTWLQAQLVANVNISQTCNAGWNGSEVRFFRSGGGCSNTGEIAAVFDHEWGHGIDDNDGVPSVSSPGEGIADTYAALRLNDSCIGRNFRPGVNCSGETALAGACTACTGVRDIDFAKHVGQVPFTLASADTCAAGGNLGPCGGSVHCEGQTYSQAIWDLWNRDLVGAPFNLDRMVTREIATELTFRGASGVSAWFACTGGTGGCGNAAGCGCAATSGYMQYLAADDDNGNLNDGTPHMSAISAAFTRHGIACTTIPVANSGCAATPTQAPVVTTQAIDGGVSLTWTASAGATAYRVHRTEGVRACDYGKDLVATVTGTSYLDLGLRNGRAYSYIVVPVGGASECLATASTCATATPLAGPASELVATDATFTTTVGDGDLSIDNCEVTTANLPFANTGSAAASNLRVLSVTSTTHPGTVVLTAVPFTIAANQASCGLSTGNFQFVPEGLDPGETITFAVTYTSDELSPLTRTTNVSFSVTEADFTLLPTKTFTFEASREGWVTTSGTFNLDTGVAGGNTTAQAMRSSNALNDQCDVVESPIVLLSPDSTMSVWTHYNVEAMDTQWWDRANLGVRPVGGDRTTVAPDGGRLYNASGVGVACGISGQAGWAGNFSSWAASNWSATALQSATFANRAVKLEMRYGTDSSVAPGSFRFDQVTLTNVREQGPDAQSNVCTPPPDDMFLDGFED